MSFQTCSFWVLIGTASTIHMTEAAISSSIPSRIETGSNNATKHGCPATLRAYEVELFGTRQLPHNSSYSEISGITLISPPVTFQRVTFCILLMKTSALKRWGFTELINILNQPRHGLKISRLRFSSVTPVSRDDRSFPKLVAYWLIPFCFFPRVTVQGEISEVSIAG